MTKPLVFSVIESPLHPKLSTIIGDLGYEEMQFTSVRKTVSALKKHQPDVIIADFIYAYSNNYASNHISNLDTLLITLQKYPDYHPKFIFLCVKEELQYVDQLINEYLVDSDGHCLLAIPTTDDVARKVLVDDLQG